MFFLKRYSSFSAVPFSLSRHIWFADVSTKTDPHCSTTHRTVCASGAAAEAPPSIGSGGSSICMAMKRFDRS